MATKNLGQVAAIWLGTSAPENTSLIWFDTTPAIRKHKVYDEDLADWVVLDNDAISAITYSELQTLAQDPGLTLGSWYRITDPEYANTLALAITSTKIKYVDINNNLIIDDLAGSKTYVVNSSNLTIDEIAGTWDALQKKLNFPFSRLSGNSDRGDDLVLVKRTVSSTTEFAVYTFRSLVSSHSSNSLTWANNGIFFNFVAAVNNIINVNNGVVGYNQYQIDIANINQALSDMAQAVASSIEANQQYTDGAIEELNVYARQIPTAPVVPANPETIAVNDSLQTICGKIQYWLEKLATQSDGIKVASGYAPRTQFITPGVSTLTKWMENREWESYKGVKYLAIIRASEDFINLNGLFGLIPNASVLVKRGNYVLSDTIELTNLYANNGVLVFEPGVKITANLSTIFGSNYSPSGSENILFTRGRIIGNGCVIRNENSSLRCNAFVRCHNISGFKFEGTKTNVINYCNNVRDCECNKTPTPNGENLLQTNQCQWVSNCACSSILNCSYVTNCRVYNPLTGTTGEAVMAKGSWFVIFNYFSGSGYIASDCYSDEFTTQIGPSAAGGFNHIPD